MKTKQKLFLQLVDRDPASLRRYLILSRVADVTFATLVACLLLALFFVVTESETNPKEEIITALSGLVFMGIFEWLYLQLLVVVNPAHKIVTTYRAWERRMISLYGWKVFRHEELSDFRKSIEEVFMGMAERVVPLKVPAPGSMERLRDVYDVATERLDLAKYEDLCHQSHVRFEQAFFT